jgi:hypothetical protein
MQKEFKIAGLAFYVLLFGCARKEGINVHRTVQSESEALKEKPCLRDADCDSPSICDCENIKSSGPDKCSRTTSHGHHGYCTGILDELKEERFLR